MKYPALHFAAYVVAFAFSIFGFLSTCAPNNGYGQDEPSERLCVIDNKVTHTGCDPTRPLNGLPVFTSAANVIEDRSWRVEAIEDRYAIVNIKDLTAQECLKLSDQIRSAKICNQDINGAGGIMCKPYRIVVCNQ